MCEHCMSSWLQFHMGCRNICIFPCNRRRGSHALRDVNADKGRPRSRSPAGSRRPREPRHRSPSHEEEGQIVDRWASVHTEYMICSSFR